MVKDCLVFLSDRSYEHKAKAGQLPVAGASHIIDHLKVCPKKGEAA